MFTDNDDGEWHTERSVSIENMHMNMNWSDYRIFGLWTVCIAYLASLIV